MFYRAAAAILASAFAGGLGYLAADRHAAYYTGDTPRSHSCISCHVRANGLSPFDRIHPPSYLSPRRIAVSRDGSALFVTARDSDALVEVDVASRKVRAEIPVGRRPDDIVLTRDGRRAFVSNEWSDSVSEVDLDQRTVRRALKTGSAPSGLMLSLDEKKLFVANWQGDSVSVLDLSSGTEVTRLSGGGAPNRIALSPDPPILAVTNELAYVNSRREVPVSELTLVDPTDNRVLNRVRIENAHLLNGVVAIPGSGLLAFALVRPKNLLPVLHVARGWAMNNGLGIYDLETGETRQLLLDEPNRFYADPADVASSPDGRRIFVSHSGVDVVSVVDVGALRETLVAGGSPGESASNANRLDLSRRYVTARIPTGSGPAGLAVSPSGDYLYVAETFEDRILAVDLADLTSAFVIPLNRGVRETAVRRGEKLFASASRTFQGQFSCRSCHPRNHTDRLQYDFEPDGLGQDIVDNRSLLGIGPTGPFKWNGKNTSLFMQCGIRFARILTRVEPFSPDDLSALVAFLRSLPPPPNPYRLPDGKLTPSQQRGKYFFERDRTADGALIPVNYRCSTCHSGPYYTNRKPADVGSASPGDTVREFDTPHLRHIFSSAPYLHDGKAGTLHEIWTLYNSEDTHGVTRDMSNRDLNDLVEYLKTL